MKNLLLLILFSGCAYGQIPAYYENIDFSQSPENIKSQLAYLIRNTHLYFLDYTPQTWNALKAMDLNPENPENVLLIYGYNDSDNLTINDRSRDKDLTCHTTQCAGLWSREHIYPRSIGNYDTDSWPGTDIHGLRASDGEMNEYRSNFPYVDGEGNAGLVANYRFFPGDEWKGDIARMLMYMYLRYPNNCRPNFVGISENTYHSDMPDIFLQWNAEDPVSTYEMNRNNISETDFQGNRNPFIDNPFLATMIWGGPVAQNNWETLSVSQPVSSEFKVYPNPTTEFIKYEEHDFDRILIYNMQGILIGEDKNLLDNQTYMPSQGGLYFIKFFKENNVTVKKVLKK